MEWIGLILAVIAAVLVFLDIVLRNAVTAYRSNPRLLQWALFVLAIAVIVIVLLGVPAHGLAA